MIPATRRTAVTLRNSRWLSRHAFHDGAQGHGKLACPLVLAMTLALAACGDQSALDGDISPSVVNVADAALAGGMYSIAVSTSNAILLKYPRDAAALATKGDALLGIGDVQEAEQVYRSLLAIDPKSIRANLGLARIKLQTDPAAAEAAFLAVLHDDPRNVAAWSDIGIARDLQGRHADAQQAYRSALGIAPDNVGARVNLGLSLALSGRPDEGVRLLQPLAELPAAPGRIRDNLALARSLAGEIQRTSPDQEPTRTAATAAGVDVAQPAARTGPPRTSVDAISHAARSPAVASMSVALGEIVQQAALPSLDPAAAAESFEPPGAYQPDCWKTWSSDRPGETGVSAAWAHWPSAVPCAIGMRSLPIEELSTAPGAMAAPSDGDATATKDDVTISVPLQHADTVGHELPTGAAWSEMLLQSVTGIPDEMLLSASIELASPTTATDDERRSEARQNRMACPSCAGRIPLVQVGSLDSETAAHIEWDRLVARMPALFAGHERIVAQAEIGGRSFWRLRIDGFSDLGEATAFCSQLTSAGAGCWAVLASR